MTHFLKASLVTLLITANWFVSCSKDLVNSDLTGSPNSYYFDPNANSFKSDGTVDKPFTDLSQVKNLQLNPGDSILLRAGTTSRGTIQLKDIHGSVLHPIVISCYGSGKFVGDQRALIDAKGYSNGILLENCSNVVVENLVITSNAGQMQLADGQLPDMKCGILVQATETGVYNNITLSNLVIRDIFYEEPGFTRGVDEVRSANGTQHYGWGIRFINKTSAAVLKDLKVENCQITNTGHTGLKFTAKGYGIENISVSNNEVSSTGGPGIQMSGVKNGLVSGNKVNGSGSNDDSRKWGRGSGLWTWGTADVVIEHNSFMNAHGPGDSAGCHIDFNCKNVVVQYNLSANNAGGFCEILGNNYNCSYRYNISVNDGYRVKGEDGAFQDGKIFWLSGYVGKGKKTKGPFDIYFYNNTIYTKKDIVAKFAVANTTEGVLIANNIFCIEGESQLVPGDQYVPDKINSAPIPNCLFKNNLYLTGLCWPKEVMIQDQYPLIGNPEFRDGGGLKLEDYVPQNIQLIKDKGIKIQKIPNDQKGLVIGLKVEKDILGKKISGNPDLGAIELQ